MAAALIAPTGDAPLHDAASMAARLRCLTREDGDVAMAASIVDDLLGRRHTPTSGVAATSWHASSVGVPGASLGLPRAVGAHYLKYVLDWLVSQLVRQQAGGAPKPQQGAKQGGGTTGGHTTPAAAAQVQQGIQPHALTRPGAWRLLADLLSGDWGGAAASAAVPASILIAAAAATRHAVGEGGRAAADGVNSGKGSGGADGGSDDTEPSQLLAAVDAVLRALMMPKDCSGRGSSSNIGRAQQHGGRSGGVGAPPSSAASAASAFRPSLEQLVALVAGVLDVQPPRSVLGGSDLSPDDVGAESAWARLAATCVWCLERSAASSANPKKVFTSVVGRLMAPLTPLAFPTPDDSSGSSGGSGDDVRSQLAAAARALLEVSLLHEVHVVGIAAAAGAKLEAADAKLKEAAAGGGGDAGASGDAQGGKKAKRQKAAKGAGQQEQGQEEAAAAAAAGADGGDGGEACGARTYHGLLFQVLEEGVAALKDGSGGGVSAACAPQHARVQQAHGLLLSMPWLLVGFCRVAARHRSVLAADAAAAAAHGRRPGQMHGGGGSSKHGGGGREAAKGGGEGGGGASSSTSLVGAEFRLFSVLSGMLLGQLAGSASLSAQLPGGAPQAPPVAHATPPGKAAGQRKRGRGTDEQQQQQQLGGTSVAPVAAVVAASSGERRAPLAFAMAALLEAVRATGTYQPTRDLSGAQRGVLTRAAASLVAAANDPRGMGGLPTAPGSGSTDSAGRQKQTQQQLLPALAVMSVDADAARLVVGVSAAMCALLDLDHRTLQPVLDDVWRLLWLTAAAGTSATLPPGVEGGAEEAGPLGTADAGAAAGSTAAFVTTHISVRGGGGAHSVSVSACVRLVFAYKELRQLHVLMGSMLGALRAVAVTGGGGGGGDSATDDTGSAAEGAVAAAAAAEVARDPRLLRALSTAVRDLPPGQSPGLVDLIATDLEQQLGGAGGEDGSGGGSGRVPSSSSGAVLLAVGDIYCACLSALSVQLTTAVPLARSVERLLGGCLSPRLLRAVAGVCEHAEQGSSSGGGAGKPAHEASAKKAKRARAEATARPADASLARCEGALLSGVAAAEAALLMQLYAGVVRLHASCATLHPDVVPLPQQGGGGSSSSAALAPTGGYCAAVASAAAAAAGDGGGGSSDSMVTVVALPRLARACLLPLCGGTAAVPPLVSGGVLLAASRESASLASAVHAALLQRLTVLGERAARLECTCELTGGGGAPPASRTAAAAGPVPDSDDTHASELSAVHFEAHALAGALLAPAAGIAAMTPDALRALMTVLRSVRSGVAATKTANSQLQWPSSAMQQVQQQQQQQPGASFLVCAWMDVVASTPVWARWADPRDTTATLQAMMLTAAEAGVCAQQQQQQQPRGDGDGGSLLTHAGAWCVRALCGEQLLQLAGVQACVPAALARATSSLLQQMASGGGAGGGDGGSSDSALVLLACLQATGDDAVEALHACHRQAASTATGQAAAAEPSPSSSAAVTAAEAAAHESEARLSSQLAATLDDQAHVMTAYVERWRDGGGIGGDGGKAPAAGGVTGDGCATDNAAPMRLAELLVLARGAHLGCLTTRQLRAVSDVALACGALCVAPLLEDAEAWAGARGVAGTLPGGRGGGRQASDASGNASRAQKRTQWALHALRCALGLACDAQSLLLVRRAAQVVADARGSGSAGSHSSNGAAVLPGSEPALNWALPLVTFAAMAQTVPAAASAASSGSGVPPDLDAAESAAAFVRVVADSAWAASSSPTAARHSSSHPGDCVRQAALRKAVLGAGAALARDAERGLGAGSGISSGGGSGGKKGRGKGAGSGVVTVTAHVTSSDGGSAQSAYCASAALAAVTSAMARAESAAASARPPAQRTSSNGAAAEAEASRQLLRDTLASLGASAATLAAAASAAAVATDAAASQQASSVAGGSDAMQRGNLLRHAAACLLAVCGHAEAVAAPPLPTASADADTDADDGQLDPLQRQRATLSLGRSLLLAGSVGGGNGGDGGVAMAGWHGGGRAALRVVSHLASVSARLPGDMRAHAARSGVGSEGGDGVGDAGDASALCGERRAIEHLLSVHVDLMGGLCPAAHAPRAHGGGSSTWATLTADVEGGSDAAHARLALLASLRGMLAACSRSQVLVVARWLADELLAGEAAWSGSGSMAHARGFGRSDGDNSGVDGAAAAAAGRGGSAPLLLLLCDAPSASAWLLPRLQATLLCLEGVASPASLSAMASASPLLWRSLLLMLPRLVRGARAQLVGGGVAAGSSVPGGGGGCARSSACAASAVVALRCLESMAGRPATFRASPARLACAAGLALELAAPAGAGAGTGGGGGGGSAAAPFHSASSQLLGVLQRTSSLLACLLRHRSAGLQRCMPLVVAGSRAMLHGFVAAARHTQGSSGRDSDDYVLHAAAELARVYEAAASGGTRVVAKYAMHMLGDYVCAAAAVVPLWALEDASGVAPSGMAADEEPVAVLTPGASAALRQGAYYLMAVLGPAELQHLHVALGTSMGGARRAALATLMAEYEKAFKFEGKV